MKNIFLPVDIQHYHYFGYYDGPLDGMLRANGTYWYFQKISSCSYDHWGFHILELPPCVKMKYLKRVRHFRHRHGWYSDINSHIKYPSSTLYREENYYVPYDAITEYEYDQLDQCTVMGITFDLKKIYFR